MKLRLEIAFKARQQNNDVILTANSLEARNIIINFLGSKGWFSRVDGPQIRELYSNKIRVPLMTVEKLRKIIEGE